MLQWWIWTYFPIFRGQSEVDLKKASSRAHTGRYMTVKPLGPSQERTVQYREILDGLTADDVSEYHGICLRKFTHFSIYLRLSFVAGTLGPVLAG